MRDLRPPRRSPGRARRRSSFLGRLVGGELHRAIADPPAPEHVHEVERLGIAALEYHSERRLRSASLL